jgi:hypothetical protein
MSEEQEKHFEHICPLKSALGREFLALQSYRNKCRQEFESSPDKMAADTLAYRRSEIALGRFLDDFIPVVMKYLEDMKTGKIGLDRAEYAAKNPMWGRELKIDRRSEQIIWTRFAIERYRIAIPKKDRKKLRMYHPQLWKELGEAWQTFRAEIKRWQSGRQPFDGSQAMHEMLAFQMKARLLASAND